MTRAFRITALVLAGVFGAGLRVSADPGFVPKIPQTLGPALEAIGRKDYPAALDYLEKEAGGGNVDACFALGELHLSDVGGQASVSEALEWYGKAVDDGDPRSQFRLGQLYWTGHPGIEKDEDHGLFLIQSAADAGYPAAWAFLGTRSREAAEAADLAPDREALFAEARVSFLKAAEAGDLPSAYEYSRLLYDGHGGPKDMFEGYAWMKKAASGGYGEAMGEIGRRTLKGEGTEANTVEALGWFLAGAERGNLQAMTNLGICYERGVGVPQSYNRAGFWFAEAAGKGLPEAQFRLGRMFELGRGTEPKPVSAYINYCNAAKGGLAEAAAARDALKEHLTPEQLEEAERGTAQAQEPAGK